MNMKRVVRCGRCGKRLKKGGDNYRFSCAVISDFDGHISAGTDRSVEDYVDMIESSDLSEQELEEQVYYKLDQVLCFECRNEIINFLKGYES